MTGQGLANDCFALPPGVEWTPVDTALAALRTRLSAVAGVEEIALAKADGRIVARDITARRTNPPSANSAIDGYGLAMASLVGDTHELPLLKGRSAAGQPFEGAVPAGRAVRILTGANVPEGVDTLIMQEDVTLAGNAISFQGMPRPGANIRRAGEDIKAGDRIIGAGQTLGVGDIALLAAAGIGTVTVFRRLSVGVLSTGDELLPAGAKAAPHQIFDVNRPMLLAMLARWGFNAVDLGHVGDDRDLLRARLDNATSRVDALLTSGGASAGDEDHMSALLGAEGSVHFWRIAMKPGRPLALGQWRGVPVFGLPGNPVAAFVCALVFARPALGVLAGGAWKAPQGIVLPAAFSKKKKPGRREYLRARQTEDGRAEVFRSEGSGLVSGLSWSGGLVELGDEGQEIAEGTPVTFYPYAAFGL